MVNGVGIWSQQCNATRVGKVDKSRLESRRDEKVVHMIYRAAAVRNHYLDFTLSLYFVAHCHPRHHRSFRRTPLVSRPQTLLHPFRTPDRRPLTACVLKKGLSSSHKNETAQENVVWAGQAAPGTRMERDRWERSTAQPNPRTSLARPTHVQPVKQMCSTPTAL